MTKYFLSFFSLCLTLAVVLPPAPTLAATDHDVAYGTPVYVRLAAPLNSRDAAAGLEVPIRVVRDVVVDGCIVIRRGAHGVAEVVGNDAAAWGGRAGHLEVELRWVRSVDHGRIGVAGDMGAVGGPNAGVAVGQELQQTGYYTNAFGAAQFGAYETLGGVVLQSAAEIEKGQDAQLYAGNVVEGRIANVMGVTIASDVRADDDGDTPVR